MSGLDRAVVKAIVRRLSRLDQESAFAAEMDAGFDAGEWSGPAHADMLEDDRAALLARFTPAQRAQVEDAEYRWANIGNDPASRWTEEIGS